MYSIEGRNAWLDAAEFPYQRQATTILFDHYDRRFREGLELILNGAKPAVRKEKVVKGKKKG